MKAHQHAEKIMSHHIDINKNRTPLQNFKTFYIHWTLTLKVKTSQGSLFLGRKDLHAVGNELHCDLLNSASISSTRDLMINSFPCHLSVCAPLYSSCSALKPFSKRTILSDLILNSLSELLLSHQHHELSHAAIDCSLSGIKRPHRS